MCVVFWGFILLSIRYLIYSNLFVGIGWGGGGGGGGGGLSLPLIHYYYCAKVIIYLEHKK